MAFKFQGFDFLHLDSNFSEDELLVRRTACDFVEDNVIPIIEECFRTERFPRELVPIMGELGFFGASLEGYGCAGMSNVEYGLVMQELERGDRPAFPKPPSYSGWLVQRCINSGTRDARRGYGSTAISVYQPDFL